MDAASFVDQFHGLSGKLLSERKKNLFILLAKYRSIGNNQNILEEITINLQPKTYLEETYKLEFLLYFKRVQELFKIVKDGNIKLADKIIKHRWFLTTILKDVTPQEFVNDICPQLSLVMRMKILKQMLKHFREEKFMDALFQELLSTYGFRTALVIISGCSLEKIKEVLTERGLKISMAQIKLLHDKDKSLIRFYYEEYHKRGGDMASLNSFTCYLSKKDPSLFMELRMKYDFPTSFRLGKQTTNFYIENNKDSIIEDPLKYLDMKVFKECALVRKLRNEFPSFLKAVFPDSLNQLKMSHVFDLLENYPKKKRYHLFSRLFREVYKMDLISVKEVMTLTLLETIPSHEEREKWVQVFDNEVEYIQFKRSTLAIPELKELLFRADNASSRMELFEYVINTCGISKDYDSLLDILKLIHKRYRNDDTSLSVVIKKIKEKMDLRKLTEEHWKYIYEIISMRDLKNLSVDDEMIMEYSKFLYKSGKSFDELIPICIKSGMYDILNWRFVDADFRDENFQKLFLKAILKYYPNIDIKFKPSWNTVRLVLIIKRWNQNHPNDLILVSHENAIIEIIQEVGRGWMCRNGNEMDTLKYLICRENNAKDFEDVYFENIKILSNCTITKWFLKNQPEVFEKHIDKVYSCFSGEEKYLTTILKKLEHLGLVEAVVKHYSEKIGESTFEPTEKDMIAQLLASIMPTASYLELVRNHIPTVEKLDLSEASEEEKTMLQIEKSIAQSVRFSSCHTKALPLIFDYCRGDCLQPALNSLYSCFNQIPEKDLKPYLSKLMNKPVSLRKHAIFLAVLVFPNSIISDVGEKMMEIEKDISVRKHIFASFYKYFCKNPSHQFWDIMQKYMESLSVHDQETLDLIINIHCIPEKYKGVFAEKIWQVLEKFEKEELNVNKHYESFFLNIRDYDIKFLTPSFCLNIIKEKLFEHVYKRNHSCLKFAIQFMMYGEDMKQTVQKVMQILHDSKTKYWNSDVGGHVKTTIYHFCSAIFDKTMNRRDLRLVLPIQFVSTFSEEWKAIFTQQETFEEYLMLEFMHLKYQENIELEEVAQKIGELFEDVRKLFGDFVIDLFQDFLKNSLKQLIGSEKYASKLLKILKYLAEDRNISSARCLLIMSLLPTRYDDSFKEYHNYILSIIQSSHDPIVGMTLNRYFKKSL